jgi:integrase
MATIQERRDENGKIRYRAMVRLKGFPTESETFDRKNDARDWAQKREVELRSGRQPNGHEARRRTAVEMIDRYMRDVLPRKRPRLRRHQKFHLEWWKKQLKGLTIAEVTPSIIAQCRDKIAQTPTRDSPCHSASSVNHYRSTLSHVFTVAIREWGWADDSPVSKVARLREPRGRLRYLDNNERERLLAACKADSNPCLYPVVVIAISTGMRQQEILSLAWTRVDLERGRVILEETKNGERRSVPITGHALDELKRLHQNRAPDTDLLFPTKVRRNRATKPIEIRLPWERALAESNIKDFRFHDLRHTAASYLAMNGATLADIAEVLGHKSIQMARRYAHLSESRVRDVVLSMNAKIFAEVTREQRDEAI